MLTRKAVGLKNSNGVVDYFFVYSRIFLFDQFFLFRQDGNLSQIKGCERSELVASDGQEEVSGFFNVAVYVAFNNKLTLK